MNKCIFMIVGLFALAACGGGSGSSGGSNREIRTPVTNNNARVTSLSTTVDNRSDVIAFVEGKLGEDYYKTKVASPRAAAARAATTPAHEKYNERYMAAANKIADMKQVLEMNRTELTEMLATDANGAVRLRDALILVGRVVPPEITNDELMDMAGAVIAKEYNDITTANKLITTKVDAVDLLSASSNQSTGRTYKFTLDNKGQIIGITTSDMPGVKIGRNDDTAVFATRIKNPDGTYSDQELTLESYGKKVGLSFTDFGNIYGTSNHFDANGVATGTESIQDAFAGGYSNKQISDTDIASKMDADTTMTFTGHATGYVKNHGGDYDSASNGLFVDGSAKLDFQANGEQTLHANFSEGAAAGSTAWYDTVLTKNTDGTYDIAFDNAKDVAINDKFKVDGAADINANAQNTASINYYGDAGNATEASGIIHYTEQQAADEYVELRSAFGVKKD